MDRNTFAAALAFFTLLTFCAGFAAGMTVTRNSDLCKGITHDRTI